MNLKFENKKQTEEFLKEFFWLAWNACGGPMGMGVLQENPGSSKEDVWKNIHNQDDYPGSFTQSGHLHADYVFGKMMKMNIKYEDTTVETPENVRSDYQSWCLVYHSYQKLVEQTLKNTGIALAKVAEE